jgi:hypothetical protein
MSRHFSMGVKAENALNTSTVTQGISMKLVDLKENVVPAKKYINDPEKLASGLTKIEYTLFMAAWEIVKVRTDGGTYPISVDDLVNIIHKFDEQYLSDLVYNMFGTESETPDMVDTYRQAQQSLLKKLIKMNNLSGVNRVN